MRRKEKRERERERERERKRERDRRSGDPPIRESGMHGVATSE